MFNKFITYFCFFIATFFSTQVFAQQNSELFGSMPLVTDVSVSPDGSSMAAQMMLDGVPSVITSPFGSKEITVAAKLKDSADRIESIDWVNNNRLFISASRPAYRNGFYFRVGTIYSVNMDGSDLKIIENNAVYKNQEALRGLRTIHLLNDLMHDDQHVLVSAFDERDGGYSVFKVNVYDSKFTKIANSTGGRHSFVSDVNGNVVFSAITEKHLMTLYYKAIGTEQWVELKTIDLTGDIDFYPIAVSEDGKSLLVNTDFNSDFNYIAKFDLSTKSIGEKLFAVEGHDIDHSIVRNGQLIGYGYTKDFYERSFISPKQIEYNSQIKTLFKNRHSFITSSSVDNQKVVIYSETDHNPGRYYTIDFNTKKADFWFSQYPKLEKTQLNPVQPIDVANRDGLKMRGYLTLPKNQSKAAPLIVFPHGGPHARDDMSFDPFVQFFAAQGYAVLQVNFRGSTGYGNHFHHQGYKQWGMKMQDDLMDAVAQVRKNPAIDATKSCVVGASYGGFAALVASFQQPEQFNCFISISGISDLPAMLQRDTEFSEQLGLYMKNAVGDYKTESDRLKTVSAMYNTDKIQRPVLLIHGVKDTRVYFKQSLDLYKALKSKNKTVEYLELENGTHFFDEEADRKQAFAAMEQFLSKYLASN